MAEEPISAEKVFSVLWNARNFLVPAKSAVALPRLKSVKNKLTPKVISTIWTTSTVFDPLPKREEAFRLFKEAFEGTSAEAAIEDGENIDIQPKEKDVNEVVFEILWKARGFLVGKDAVVNYPSLSHVKDRLTEDALATIWTTKSVFEPLPNKEKAFKAFQEIFGEVPLDIAEIPDKTSATPQLADPAGAITDNEEVSAPEETTTSDEAALEVEAT